MLYIFLPVCHLPFSLMLFFVIQKLLVFHIQISSLPLWFSFMVYITLSKSFWIIITSSYIAIYASLLLVLFCFFQFYFQTWMLLISCVTLGKISFINKTGIILVLFLNRWCDLIRQYSKALTRVSGHCKSRIYFS